MLMLEAIISSKRTNMILELEILSGDRKGRKIWLDSDNPTDILPYVLETEALSIKLTLDQDISNAELIIDNTSIRLLPYDKGKRIFYALPERTVNGILESLFFNYLGIAIFHVRLTIDSTSSLEEIGCLEVLARKASVKQVQSMIDFILSYDDDDLLRTKGPTRRSASLKKNEGLKPQQIIEQLEENLRLLQMQLPYILNAPMSTLSSKLQVQVGSPGVDMGDQGVAWIIENFSVLQPTDDFDSAILEYEGVNYLADEVQTSIIYENKDIYENRILHGYVDNLLRFTNKLLQGYNESTQKISLNQHDGYVSFFSAMSTWIKKTNTVHIQYVQNLQEQIRLIQSVLQQKIPIKKIDRTLPRFTPKVRANRQYTILFRSIHEWYQSAEVDWGNQKILLTITNIPKLFELYAVLLIRKWCTTNCTEMIYDNKSFWSGRINSCVVKLFYEPEYWMSGHCNHIGDINNTQNRTFRTAKGDKVGKRRQHQLQKRSPDIVLEIEKEDNDFFVVVLDAKYTTPQLAFERDLPDCTLKYVHGLGSWRTKDLVKAMIIVHPDNMGLYYDFHISPFDIYGVSAQLPLLGVQGLALTETLTGKNEPIHNLISRMFELLT